MPNNVGGTDRFLRWVAKELGPDTAVNLMDQYYPAHKAHEHPDISRGIRQAEFQQALAWAKQAGLKNLL
jgi:putative pyruvate formate lyase activating enzyme